MLDWLFRDRPASQGGLCTWRYGSAMDLTEKSGSASAALVMLSLQYMDFKKKIFTTKQHEDHEESKKRPCVSGFFSSLVFRVLGASWFHVLEFL